MGDIDGQGSSLIAVLDRYLSEGFEPSTTDETKNLHCETVEVQDDELFVVLRLGQSGVAADIVNKTGSLLLRQSPDDIQRVRCGALFRLPPPATIGWLAAHVNNGRPVRGLMEKGIQARFHDEFPRLILEFRPYVIGSALESAVEQNLIEKVRLIRYERPNDRAAAATDKWVSAGTAATMELSLTPHGKLEHILSNLPLRFLHGDKDAFGEIVQFQGLTFDEAKVEVVLPDGAHRTFNLEQPDAGHPLTEQMYGLQMEGGEPTVASLRTELRHALTQARPTE